MSIELSEADGNLIVSVKVKPRASKSRVLGVKDGVLEVAVAAPPVDGAANSELVLTLAKHFGVSKSRVCVVAGAASRHKRIRVTGADRRLVEGSQ